MKAGTAARQASVKESTPKMKTKRAIGKRVPGEEETPDGPTYSA